MSEIHPKILRTDAGPKRIAKSGPASLTAATAATTSPAAAELAKGQAKRATRRRLGLVAALGLSVICYAGQQRRPVGPAAGTLDVRVVVPAVSPNQNAKLKIGTYNIHGCKGTDGRTDVSRIAGVIGGLDFVGLNEVLGPAPWEQEDQAATLAKALKMTSLYTPTEERWWSQRFGNGFLTKLDVRSWQVVPMERRYGKSYRNFVHIRAKAANGVPLNIVVTHIDRSDDRERHEQLKTVFAYFSSLEKPAVLLGDMNTDAHEAVMVKLLDGTDIVDVLGKAKGFGAPRHIDWILMRGLEVVDAGLSPVGPSDHAHVWAELIVPAKGDKFAGSPPRPYWEGGADYFPPGLEFKLTREAAAMQAEAEEERKSKVPEPKPIDPAKLRKAAMLRGGLDMIEAYDGVAQLYSTKPYVSILPPDMAASEGPQDWDAATLEPIDFADNQGAYAKFEHPEFKVPEPPPVYSGSMYIGPGR